MPSTSLGAAATIPAPDEFSRLVYADEQLLATEFAEIIAAEWPGPPDPPPQRAGRDGFRRPGVAGSRAPCRARPPSRSRRPAGGGPAWQRSPPNTPCALSQKDREPIRGRRVMPQHVLLSQ